MDKECTDLHIAKIAKFLPNWKHVARQLGVESEIICDIEGGYPNPEDRRSEALMKWVGQDGPLATYKKLYDVLCELQEKKSAEKVKKLAIGEDPQEPPHQSCGELPFKATSLECQNLAKEKEDISSLELKYCILCGSRVSYMSTCKLSTTSDGCESQSYSYAAMFYYACGHKMQSEADHIVCSTCIYYILHSELISFNDVKHCILCTETLKTVMNEKKYPNLDCDFYIVHKGQMVTKSFHEYSEKGGIREEHKYNICTSIGCTSAKFSGSCNIVEDKPAVVTNPKESFHSVVTSKVSRSSYQVLVIGETGAGKTSFVNLLCNFDLVFKLGLKESLDLLHNFQNIHIDNAQAREMECNIYGAKCYKVKFDELEVRIIDTPGFGNSGEIDENKNVMKIIDTIESAEYINCICLVIHGHQACATLQLQNALTKIFVTLPTTAFNNLIIIMTNSQDVTCATFDIKELSMVFGSDIVLKPDHVFYIDNPCCKLERCQKEKNLTLHQHRVEALKLSFLATSETLVKLLEKFKVFSKFHTNCFTELYDVKSKVEKNVLELCVAQQNGEMVREVLSKGIEKLDTAIRTKSLDAKFSTTLKVKKVLVVTTDEHNTICGCITNCLLRSKLSKTMDKENIKSCDCIDEGNNYKCIECGHSYLDHLYTENKFEVIEEENHFIAEEQKKIFEDTQYAQYECAKLKAEFEAKLNQCNEEMQCIKTELISSLEKFKEQGNIQSYENVLKCQLNVLEQRLCQKDNLQVLDTLKHDLESELSKVQAVTKNEGTSGCIFYSWKAALRGIQDVMTSKKLRPVYKMLLIGETGSGKTSFFNLLCNLNLVCDLGLENGLDKLNNFHDFDIEKSEQKAMESKTTDAKYYEVMLDKLEVGIIDTPGLGALSDGESVKKIIDTIEDVEYINCILLVINSRQAHSTCQLRWALSAMLPKTAFNNIIIIVTNSKDLTCASFDLDQLSTSFGPDMGIKPDHVFYIDNPYSKLGKYRKEKKIVTNLQLVNVLRYSFQTAEGTLGKMFEKIKNFSEVHKNCFVQLYYVKKQVETKILQLFTAQQNRDGLLKEITNTKKKLDEAVSTKTLNKEFSVPYKVPNVIHDPTKKHNTICGTPDCNSNCHVPCLDIPRTFDKKS